MWQISLLYCLQVKVALRAVKEGVEVVFANGSTHQVILNILDGQRVGTFCTDVFDDTEQVKVQATEVGVDDGLLWNTLISRWSIRWMLILLTRRDC